MKFVRFECGCEGVIASTGKHYIFHECYDDYGHNYSYHFSFHESEKCKSKKFVAISENDIVGLLHKLSEACRKADRFDKIKSALE